MVNIFEYARNWSQKVPWGQPQNWANRLRRPRTPVEFHRNSEQDELILTDILAMCLAPENHILSSIFEYGGSQRLPDTLLAMSPKRKRMNMREVGSSWQQESRGGKTIMGR